jgi:hypothetical protein
LRRLVLREATDEVRLPIDRRVALAVYSAARKGGDDGCDAAANCRA